MNYPYTSLFIVPTSSRDVANAMVPAMVGQSGPNPGQSFAMPLSPDGTGEATHYCLSLPVSEEMLVAFDQVLAAGVMPQGMQYGRWDADTLAVLATNIPGFEVGSVVDDWRVCVVAAGLQQIVPSPYGE